MNEPRQTDIEEKSGLEVDHLEDVVSAAESRSPRGQQRLAAELSAYWQLLRRARCPQLVTSSGPRLDMRRTLREFIRKGGVLEELHYHERRRQRRLVILVDCNESALRPGVFVLAAAVTAVDPRITVLGFDSEVFPLQRVSVQGLERRLRGRCRLAFRRGQRFLDLCDLDGILRDARRFAAGTPQTYLLIISDLFVNREREPSASAVERMRQALLAYRKTWVVNTWPGDGPFVESADGAVTCSARGLCEFIDRQGGPVPKMLVWRRSGTADVWQLPASILMRLVRMNEQILLEGRRFTPYLRRLGFVTVEQATSGSRLTYVPRNSCQDFADIFRQATPF
ncbi:MAG TPA: VWA domain-containing protein [Planctomycetota bacterium]|nr:VWA domain-containing protein [Planctomycetota bacterium]